MKKYQELKNILAAMENDVVKFYENETNAAGARIRKQLQSLKKCANEMRSDIQEIKAKRK